MSTPDRVQIRKLATGVPGLDEILGGGLPEYSFNLIAGAPGGGKTTLAHQLLFANATPERPALYFTVLGEPALKMLRYQQQFRFFDQAKLNTAVRFVNLSRAVLDGDLGIALAEIVREVEASSPSLIVVDSFRTLVGKSEPGGHAWEVEWFVQQLALHLASWQATTFLIGEYDEAEIQDNPVFTVADGLIWLNQHVERNSIVRKMQVMKLRGQASVPGLHTFRITEAGIQAFPRTFSLGATPETPKRQRRLSTGVAGLDAMMGGGFPEGDSILVVAPSGAGKSLLGAQFIAEGLRAGEPGVVATFEERPEKYVGRAEGLGFDLAGPRERGDLRFLDLRLLDLSVDETVREIIDTVKEVGARRLVIDSLAGFEMALAPGYRLDFRESLYRTMSVLKRLGVTVLSTVEVQECFTGFALSPYAVSFLSDDIVRMRHVSINGQLRKMLVIVKMRRSQHSIDIHEFTITQGGITIGEPLRGYHGLTSGIPGPWGAAHRGPPTPNGTDLLP